MRRVGCHACDRVVVEQVPWSTGKHHLTDIYRCFLARWARKLSWTEVAGSFRTSWDQVYHSVQYVVEYGLAHRRLDQVTALGVDEIQSGKGNHFLTLVYQIDTHCRWLLWMGEKRTMKTLGAGFTVPAEPSSDLAHASAPWVPPTSCISHVMSYLMRYAPNRARYVCRRCRFPQQARGEQRCPASGSKRTVGPAGDCRSLP